MIKNDIASRSLTGRSFPHLAGNFSGAKWSTSGVYTSQHVMVMFEYSFEQ